MCWLIVGFYCQEIKTINIATNIPVVSLKGDTIFVRTCNLSTLVQVALKMGVVLCASQTINSLVNSISLHDAPCFANSQALFLFFKLVCSWENPSKGEPLSSIFCLHLMLQNY